jgi:5-formyltetrahydrofolate cyclo-ligase
VDLQERKASLRRELLARRARFIRTPGVVARCAAAAVEHLQAAAEFAEASTLALYAALPDEMPTRELFAAARRGGKRTLLPRVAPGRAAALEFCDVETWEELRPGRYGVLQPALEAPAVDPDAIELVLLPGVAFDRAGRRLGRGRGYYDRTFPPGARPGCPRLFGLAFACQLVDEVPGGERDRRVDAVVTEDGVLRIDRAGERPT